MTTVEHRCNSPDEMPQMIEEKRPRSPQMAKLACSSLLDYSWSRGVISEINTLKIVIQDDDHENSFKKLGLGALLTINKQIVRVRYK